MIFTVYSFQPYFFHKRKGARSLLCKIPPFFPFQEKPMRMQFEIHIEAMENAGFIPEKMRSSEINLLKLIKNQMLGIPFE